MRIDKKIAFAVVAVTVVVIGAAVFLWLRAPADYAEKTESITIGIPFSAGAFTPIYIAQDQHFFAENGINVNIRDYDQGLDAIDGMLKGEVDIAGAS